MKVHEYTKIEIKLGLKSRNAGDRLSWFEHEGVVIVRTKRSHGNKDLPEHLIRQQLKLNERQFSDLIDCPLTREGYIEILTTKGLIKPPSFQGTFADCGHTRAIPLQHSASDNHAHCFLCHPELRNRPIPGRCPSCRAATIPPVVGVPSPKRKP